MSKYTKDIQFNANDEGKLYASIQFDKTVALLSILEKKSPLFLPFITTTNTTNVPHKMLRMNSDVLDIDDVIDSKNDLLKFQYIQMIKDGDEQGHMMYLLSDTGINSEERFENYKFKVKQEERLKNMKIIQKKQDSKVYAKLKDLDRIDIKSIRDNVKRIIQRVDRLT